MTQFPFEMVEFDNRIRVQPTRFIRLGVDDPTFEGVQSVGEACVHPGFPEIPKKNEIK